MPQGLKVSFSKFDKAYEKFIGGPQLVKNNEVVIDGSFSNGPDNVKVNVDKNVVKAEKFSREALRDCFGVTTMLQMLYKRLEKAVKGELSEEGEAWDPEAELKLTMEWLELVLVSCYRTGAFLQSIQIMTKDSLREATLDNLYGHNNTKKDIRYSHYAVDNMFGPCSTDFEPYVSPSNWSHNKYKLVPKRESSGSASKAGTSAGTGQNKRGHNPWWDNSRNKRGNYSNNNVKEISGQEALRRARQNSAKQLQNFRDNWGKGKKPFRRPWNRNAKGKGYRR